MKAMPLYEFRCDACEKRFEELVASATMPPPACPDCASETVTRLYSSFATEWKPSIVNWHRVGSSWGAKPPKKNF
jgi:putative FmdB family regulatory protein